MNMQYDVVDFEKEVLNRSYKIPILVDFWAEWCAPCRMLSPVLERLAGLNKDSWALAKVDTEQLTDVAVKYNIQSIPNVKLFFEGKVVSEFVGALPEYSVVQWLRKNLPSKLQGQIDLAKTLIAEDRKFDAQKLLENILTAEPQNQEVKVLLAKLYLFDNPEKSAGFANDITDPKYMELAEAVKTLSRLLDVGNHPERLPENPSKEKYLDAIADVHSKNFDAALGKLIDIIRSDRTYDDDGSRKACIAIFKFLGEEHEITRKHRRDFGSALYV